MTSTGDSRTGDSRTGDPHSGPAAQQAAQGLVVPPGRGRTVRTAAQQVTFKVTGQHTRTASSFEVVVPPGFDVGAHVHARSEEFFYVLEGELDIFAFEPLIRTPDGWREWRSAGGDRVHRATAGTVVLVPPGCPHAFANPTGSAARMLFQSAPPPDHERYFEELLEILAAGGPPDDEVVAGLRARYDIEQLTPLRHGRARTKER
ncbi:cupin domain-containing protein [Streptomyces oryzae]|uniref:Cupin domain-containing protein n=1 Tax=Streptomyces oryzae TaxID=1434886 RepID=A0ABS3XFG0_9ACTN|nr:cupin domain-containing protein [Streptomyces oryzae]MBO8194041.1 cupin domain-containing protein [Streptomyces oryzae]